MSPLSRYSIPLALLILAGTAARPAQAQLVKDGGFESALSGPANSTFFFNSAAPFDANWAVTGEVGIDNADVFVFNGSKSLFLNSGIGTDSISQNIATTPGSLYNLSFYANDDTPGDLLNVSFGGVALAPIAVPANGYSGPGGGNLGAFTFYSFNVLATAPFSGLTFSSTGSLSSGQLELDDISAAPVPEAATTLSFGLLLLLGLGATLASAKKAGPNKTSVPA